jgi:hypothetical protein
MWDFPMRPTVSFNVTVLGPNRGTDSAKFPSRTVSAVHFVRSMSGRPSLSLLRCSDSKYYSLKLKQRCRHPRALANDGAGGRLAILFGWLYVIGW